MTDEQLLRLADQPGVKLNAYEERRLDRAWRDLQARGTCGKPRTKARTPATYAGCGGRR